MAMSDCKNCLDTPCSCGYEYRNLKLQERISLAALVLGVEQVELYKLDIPEYHPQRDKK